MCDIPMKVLMVSPDSKIPNLALMKLSTFHKLAGDKVSLTIPDPDTIYVSILLKKNGWMADSIQKMYPDAVVRAGGVGYSAHIQDSLPDEIERLKPDYELYPDQAYSMGFTTRGCTNQCHFCVVPQKEGWLKRWQHPKEFHDDRFDTMMILDNNWLADKDWFMETSGWIRDKGLTVIEHGMDIDHLDFDTASRLADMKFEPKLHFAFDFDQDEPGVRTAIKLLNDVGINVRSNVMFYVYVDSPKAFESGLRRCNILKSLDASPFVMYNIDNKPDQRIMDLRKWANRKHIFWSSDFWDYHARRKVED